MTDFNPFADEGSQLPERELAASAAVEEAAEEEVEIGGEVVIPDHLEVFSGAALLDEELEPPELGLGPDDTYWPFPGNPERPYKIVRPFASRDPRHDWLFDPAERNQGRAFYVSYEGKQGTIYGLVPWLGSQVVWPWEQAWTQDLYFEEKRSALKDEKKR